MFTPERLESTTTGAPAPVPLRTSSRPVPFGPIRKVSSTLIHLSRSGARSVLPMSGDLGRVQPVLGGVGGPARLRRLGCSDTGPRVRPWLGDGEGRTDGGEGEGSEYGSASVPTGERDWVHGPMTPLICGLVNIEGNG